MTTKEVFKNEVPEGNKSMLDNGAFYIPIGILEDSLDQLHWSTKNFQYQIFKDGYANLCVAASLELQISYTEPKSGLVTRTFVGASNFSLSSIEPNTHFLATAKSECIKNAASDIGRFFGRGLNEGIVPNCKKLEHKSVKLKPDSKIMKQLLEAIEKKDEAAIRMLDNIYDIKIEDNVEEK